MNAEILDAEAPALTGRPSASAQKASSPDLTNAGWHINVRTLRPVITDPDRFREVHRDDPARHAIEALWTGRLDTAERLLAELIERDDRPRFRALRADLRAAQGRTDEAITAFQLLIDDTRSTALESTMWQHLGKVLFGCGRFDEATTAFSRALDLRIAHGAGEELIQSTMIALDRAKTLAQQFSEHPVHGSRHEGAARHAAGSTDQSRARSTITGA